VPTMLKLLGISEILAFSILMSTAWSNEATAGSAPTQMQERDVKSLTEQSPVTPWKPGDPVRVVPDLREDGKKTVEGEEQAQTGQPLKPIVRNPVAPGIMDQNINDLPKVQPPQEGEPVRVVPDLRESGPQK